MKQYKKAQVVMLATKEKTTSNDSPLFLYPDGQLLRSPIGNQHIYITSDDKLRGGDYYIWLDNYVICRAEIDLLILNNHLKKGHIKKIIATTDKSLIEECRLMRECFPPSIAQISSGFISYFVEEYNKGNVITEVLVEYEEWKAEIKINTDSTIKIKPVGETWNDVLNNVANSVDINSNESVMYQLLKILQKEYHPPKKL